MAEKTAATFSFDTVACLVAGLQEHGVTLGNRHYEIMAKLDGERSASSFEHQFRKVKARAKELAKDTGDASTKATTMRNTKAKTVGKAVPKAAAGDDEATPTTKKRGRGTQKKAAPVKMEEHDDVDGEDEVDGEADAGQETPSKKVKLEADVEANTEDAEMADAREKADDEARKADELDEEFKEFFSYGGSVFTPAN